MLLLLSTGFGGKLNFFSNELPKYQFYDFFIPSTDTLVLNYSVFVSLFVSSLQFLTGFSGFSNNLCFVSGYSVLRILIWTTSVWLEAVLTAALLKSPIFFAFLNFQLTMTMFLSVELMFISAELKPDFNFILIIRYIRNLKSYISFRSSGPS